VARTFGRCACEPRLSGEGCSLHLLNIRNGIHSSTENVSSGSQTPQHPSEQYRHSVSTRSDEGRCRQPVRNRSALVIAVPTPGDPSGESEPMVRDGG
jgi:hypothetical protein